ncbi:MAG: hypothetical protein QMB16_09770 [Paracoccaceae bacterium]
MSPLVYPPAEVRRPGSVSARSKDCGRMWETVVDTDNVAALNMQGWKENASGIFVKQKYIPSMKGGDITYKPPF